MKYPTLRVVFDRKKLATHEKKGLVQIEIMHDGKRKWISTGVKLYEGQWKDKCMVCMRSDALELNDQINLIVNNIREWINNLFREGGEFSFDKLDKMLTQVNSPDSFLLFVEGRIEGRKIEESTRKQHYVMLNTLKEFGVIEYFSDLTLKNIKLWDDYIKNKVKEQSSVYGYHKSGISIYFIGGLHLDNRNEYC